MRIPTLRKNSDGRSFAVWPRSNGKRIYFGRTGEAETEKKYQTWLARLLADEAAYVAPLKRNDRRTVATLVEEHTRHLEAMASGAPGWKRNRSDFANQVLALRGLVELFGDEPADEFGPKRLTLFQRHLIRQGLSRTTINTRIGRIKRFFKWAASQELVPATVPWGLSTVAGLKKGRTAAKEMPPVRPVPWSDVAAIVPFVSPTVAGMLQLQFFGGMRPAEVCIMRGCDIDRSGEVWLYRPARHKNTHREQHLVKAIPRVAQAVLKPFLEGREPTAYLFTPAESDAWLREAKAEERKKSRTTKVYPCEARRVERKKAAAERRRQNGDTRMRECFDTGTYYQCVTRGFSKAEKAGVSIPHWHPNQLRHSVATQIDGWFGRQAAQRWLGHARLDTTGIYVESQIADLVKLAQLLDQRWTDRKDPPTEEESRSAG